MASHRFPLTCALASSLLFASAQTPEEPIVPLRSEAGQTLDVPQDELDRGMVYHAQPGEDSQITISVAATLQRAVFTTSRAVGYIVSPFELEDEEVPVLSGAFRIPVVSLSSGIESIDGLLRSAQFLDAQKHPEITFRVNQVNGSELVGQAPDRRAYQLKLTGTLEIKGQSIPLTLDSSLAFMPSSGRTFARNAGDLAILETAFPIRLADYGWANPRGMADRIPEELRVEVYLMLNTISPDKSGDPRDDPAMFRKQVHFLTLLRDLQDDVAAYEFARQFMTEIWQDQKEMLRLATAILETPGIPRRDFGLAQKAVRRVLELSPEDPEAGALLAQVHHEMGDHAQAISLQESVIRRLGDSPDQRLAERLRARLELYRAAAGNTPR